MVASSARTRWESVRARARAALRGVSAACMRASRAASCVVVWARMSSTVGRWSCGGGGGWVGVGGWGWGCGSSITRGGSGAADAALLEITDSV